MFRNTNKTLDRATHFVPVGLNVHGSKTMVLPACHTILSTNVIGDGPFRKKLKHHSDFSETACV